MRPWMHMRIASTAKAYSGAVALSLVQDGVMSLDDTVGELLPWTNPDWHPVTLAQELHHTSGIPDFTGSSAFVDAFLASRHDAPSPRKLLSYVRHQDLLFTPDSEYEYSNSDNIVVGLMVKAATGERYERSLSQLVTDPLQLTGTSLPRGDAMPQPFMRGYQWDDGDPPHDVTHFNAAGWAWASLITESGSRPQALQTSRGQRISSSPIVELRRGPLSRTRGNRDEPHLCAGFTLE